MKPSTTALAALAFLLTTLGSGSAAFAQDPAPGAPKSVTFTNEGGKCGPLRPLLEANKDQLQSFCPGGEKPRAQAVNTGCGEGEVISVTVTCSGGPPAEPAPAPAPGPAPAPAPGASGEAKAEMHIKPAAPAMKVPKKITTPIIVSGVLAGAALASGVVFGIMASSDHSSYKNTPDDAVARSGESKAFIADVSFGVAGLFGLAALALYFLPDEEEAPPPSAPAPGATPATPPSARTHRVVLPSLASAFKGEVLRF